jgi:hypothetical protein
MKPTKTEMMLASISKLLDKGFVMPCCRQGLDTLLQMYILTFGGNEAAMGNEFFRSILADAGVLQDI